MLLASALIALYYIERRSFPFTFVSIGVLPSFASIQSCVHSFSVYVWVILNEFMLSWSPLFIFCFVTYTCFLVHTINWFKFRILWFLYRKPMNRLHFILMKYAILILFTSVLPLEYILLHYTFKFKQFQFILHNLGST